MPKNHFGEDVQWIKIPPIFSTSNESICKIINRRLNKDENSSMDERGEYIELNYSFIGKRTNKLIPCAKCFKTLVLGEE